MEIFGGGASRGEEESSCSESAQPAQRRQQEIVFNAAESTIEIIEVETRTAQEDAVESAFEIDMPNGRFKKGDLMKPMTMEELDKEYGNGFKMMQSLGYQAGQSIGKGDGIAEPLRTASPQEALAQLRGRRGICESTEERHTCSMHVDPPECRNCKKSIWPAKMGNKSRQWVCSNCCDWLDPCVICQLVTWDGYNLSVVDGGKWMCSGCWSSSELNFQQCWSAWFQKRLANFPHIPLTMTSAKRPASKILDFKWDSSRCPVRSAPKKLKQYSLSRKNIAKLEWEGHIPDEGARADQVDRNFLIQFLASRPIPGTTKTFAKSLLQPPTEHSQDGFTWFRYEIAWQPREIIRKKKLLREGWRRAFHGTQWQFLYSILCNGVKGGASPGRRSRVGVFSHATLWRASAYQVWTFMPDGVAWTVCCEVLIDPAKSIGCGNQQTCSNEEGVFLIAFWISGITFAEMKNLAISEPGYVSLVGQWDPASETHPETFDKRSSLHP